MLEVIKKWVLEQGELILKVGGLIALLSGAVFTAHDWLRNQFQEAVLNSFKNEKKQEFKELIIKAFHDDTELVSIKEEIKEALKNGYKIDTGNMYQFEITNDKHINSFTYRFYADPKNQEVIITIRGVKELLVGTDIKVRIDGKELSTSHDRNAVYEGSVENMFINNSLAESLDNLHTIKIEEIISQSNTNNTERFQAYLFILVNNKLTTLMQK